MLLPTPWRLPICSRSPPVNEQYLPSAASFLLPVRVQAERSRFRHLGPFWFAQPSRACPLPAATLAEFGGSRGDARRSCQPRHQRPNNFGEVAPVRAHWSSKLKLPIHELQLLV